MNPLIAVVTCLSNQVCADAQRRTWCVGSPIPVRFFVGQPKSTAFARRPLADEIMLDCSDAYEDLPRKVQLAIYWARCNGFTEFVKLDDDAYCRPERTGLDRFDYVGKMMPAKRGYPKGYAHGGAGYALNQRAMDIVITTPIPHGEFSEDGYVANALAAQGIVGRNDPRFIYVRRVKGNPFPETPTATNDIITSVEFAPSEFREVQRLWAGRSVEEQMSADEYRCLLKQQGRWKGL